MSGERFDMNPVMRKLLMLLPPVRNQILRVADLETRVALLASSSEAALGALDATLRGRIALLENRMARMRTDMGFIEGELAGSVANIESLESAPTDTASALERVKTAKVHLRPFPYIVVKDALPTPVFEKIRENWPRREKMSREPGHDRYWAYYEGSGGDVWRDQEWAAIKREAIDPMFAAIAERLRPWFDARFSGNPELEPRLLSLHEAGSSFVEHQPHTHFEHNPEYAFTVIFCVDDNGYHQRGTTLYDFVGLPSEMQRNTDDAMMKKASGLLSDHLKPRIVVPFEPNRLLAFVDGPTAIHGSTPFDATFVNGPRRMILSHVSGVGQYLSRPRSEVKLDAAFYVEQYSAYRAGDRALKPIMKELLAIERGVLETWN
jgi:hypothetical protein